MLKMESNTGKNVYGIEKASSNNKLFLKWKSTGLSDFLVMSSSLKEDVTISDENKDQFISVIDRVKKELINERVVRLQDNNSTYYLVSLDELRRDGGLQIKNMPLYFAVYGIEIKQDDLTVYYETKSHASNIYSMTVDVVIKDEPYYVEKRSLFKKSNQYSGFHRVTVSTPYPTLVGGIIKYNINGFTYPFPDEVIKNGGSFYVNADNNLNLHFESSNQGIIIK